MASRNAVRCTRGNLSNYLGAEKNEALYRSRRRHVYKSRPLYHSFGTEDGFSRRAPSSSGTEGGISQRAPDRIGTEGAFLGARPRKTVQRGPFSAHVHARRYRGRHFSPRRSTPPGGSRDVTPSIAAAWLTQASRRPHLPRRKFLPSALIGKSPERRGGYPGFSAQIVCNLRETTLDLGEELVDGVCLVHGADLLARRKEDGLAAPAR